MGEQMFDADIFRERLEVAKGNRSWAEYARDAGVSRQRVSQMVNKTVDAVPTVNMLKKLAMAAKNDITLMDLAEAVGYTAEDLTKKDETRSEKEKRMHMSEDERNVLAEGDLVSGIKEMVSAWNYYQSPEDFINDFRMLYECEESVYDIKEPLEVNGVSLTTSTLCYPVVASWMTPGTVNEVPFLLFAMKKDGRGRNLLFFDCTFSAQRMHELSVLPQSIEEALKGDDLKDYDPAHIIRDMRPKTETDRAHRFLLELFSGERNGYFAKTFEGFGFRVADYKDGKRRNLISEDTLREFVKKHANVYMASDEGREFYHQFVEEKQSPASLYADDILSENKELITGYSIIAEVIASELDCEVSLHDGDESSPENPPVIMAPVENVDYEGIQEEGLLLAMMKYAKELGLKRYGRQYYTETHPRLDVDQFAIPRK